MNKSIKTIRELQNLIINGEQSWKQYGEVVTREKDDLIIFNYTNAAQYERRWNFFECVSRGLIMNKNTGEIVARPFDKFFNWGEGERKSNGYIITITEKLDGSLGIMYRDNDKYAISTRGSFDSEQAIWATEFIQKFNLSDLPNEYTLLFEIIYPENRIVIDYGNKKDLILLSVRNRFSGDYLSFSEIKNIASKYGFSLPTTYEFSNVEDVIKQLPNLDGNQEGYVIEFSDGQRFKFKGDKYIELHRLIYSLSFKNTLIAIESGTVDNICSQIPDGFLNLFNSWINEIKTKVNEIEITTKNIFQKAPKNDRKTFALWVMKNHKDMSTYLFLLFDNKDIIPAIYKNAFKDRKNDMTIENEQP